MSDLSGNKMDTSMLTQCLDFTKTLILSKNSFKFHIKLATGFDFSFTQTKEPEFNHPRTKEVIKKSPSTIRRNAARKKKYLEEKNKDSSHKKKGETAVITEPIADSFKCDKCEHEANCKVSLMKHISKDHKQPVTHERFKCNMCGENLDTKNCQTNHMISMHNQPGEIFTCDHCEFETSRKTGLSIHLSKKHKEIKQLDGNNSDVEETYAELYWENDSMGQTYKRYLDAIQDINDSNLTKEEKDQETERAKGARKDAYLKMGYTVKDVEEMPPWNSV